MRFPVGVATSSASKNDDGYGKRQLPPDGFRISQPERMPQSAVSLLFWQLRLPLGCRAQLAPQWRTHAEPDVSSIRKTPPGGVAMTEPLRLIVICLSVPPKLRIFTSVMPPTEPAG